MGIYLLFIFYSILCSLPHQPDLSIVEERVKKKDYNKMHEFTADITKIFDNCRYYNPSDSPFYQCADVLEKFYVQKIKGIKT